MKNVQIPGAAWIIGLTIVNALPMALQDAFPGAIWVPIAVDLLVVAAKAITVYMPRGISQDATAKVLQAGYAAPAAMAAPDEIDNYPAPAPSKARTFLFG